MLRSYDIVNINGSKLDDFTKLAIFKHPFYNIHRRDRDRYGSGLLVFIKKEYRITKSQTTLDHEPLHLQLSANDHNLNFIFSYKPPSSNDASFIEFLENFLQNIDLSEDIFIIGDLNLDLN